MAKRGKAAHKKIYSTHQPRKPNSAKGSLLIRKRMRTDREAAAALKNAKKVQRRYNAGDKEVLD